MTCPILVTALLLATPAIAAAQQSLSREGLTGFAIEAIRPSIQGRSITAAAYFLSAHHELKPGTRLVVELPLAHSSFQPTNGATLTDGIIGNPYVGMEFVGSGTTIGSMRSDAKCQELLSD